MTGPGALSEDLVFKMSPPAIIRGRVTDPDGNPVARAIIQVPGMPLLGYNAAHRSKRKWRTSGANIAFGTYRLRLRGGEGREHGVAAEQPLRRHVVQRDD